MKNEFFYPSSDGVTQIHAIEWKPETEVKAVLQMCHGMVEYIDRYDAFATYLTQQGYYVVGHDHLGHGQSVKGKEEFGFFAEANGNQCVIEDIHMLRSITVKKYPGVPYFVMGHSMGSFLVRQYIQMHGRGLAGAIVMGTGYQPRIVLYAGKALCKIIAAFKGWHYQSRLVHKMAFGAFNKKFQPSKTDVDWVTSDEEMLERYVQDPLCGFMFTVNAYESMFNGMLQLKMVNMRKIPRNLPIFFVAGAEDPVGNFGKYVEKVSEQFKTCGIKDIKVKLYEGDRHEILNETDRQQVYQDLYEWLEEKRKL